MKKLALATVFLTCSPTAYSQTFPSYFSPSVGITCQDNTGQSTLQAKVGGNVCNIQVSFPDEYKNASIRIQLFGVFEGEVNSLQGYGKIKVTDYRDFGVHNYPSTVDYYDSANKNFVYRFPSQIIMEPFQSNIEQIKQGFAKYTLLGTAIDITDAIVLAHTGGQFSLKTIGTIVSQFAEIAVGEVQPTWIQAVAHVCDSNGLNCSQGGTNWLPVR